MMLILRSAANCYLIPASELFAFTHRLCTTAQTAVLDDTAKNWLQAIAWLAAGIGAAVAIIKLWTESRASREQRERDLRWRQAEAGKSLNDEMQTDNQAWPALQMLDSPERVFTVETGERLTISHADIARALTEEEPGDEIDRLKLAYIRDCFDTLFYYFAIIDHYIANTLIREGDVAYPLEYYVPLLTRLKTPVTGYLLRYKLSRALQFLKRYREWNDTL